MRYEDSTAVMNVSSITSAPRSAVKGGLAQVESQTKADLVRPKSGIGVRTSAELLQMRRAGELVHRALDAAVRAAVPGITTFELDAIASDVIRAAGGTSLFLGYESSTGSDPFPASTCISINEEVVHGVPGSRRLVAGDIVSIDCGVRLNGWCADAAVTVPVGGSDPASMKLIDDGRRLLAAAIAMMRPGRKWSEVARVLEAAARRDRYGIVRDFVGHGIGRELHEQPQVPCFLTDSFLRGYDFTLEAGMTLCVEPMLTLGTSETEVASDGWTVRTCDGRRACHVEHTIAITRFGAEVLTDGRTA